MLNVKAVQIGEAHAAFQVTNYLDKPNQSYWLEVDDDNNLVINPRDRSYTPAMESMGRACFKIGEHAIEENYTLESMWVNANGASRAQIANPENHYFLMLETPSTTIEEPSEFRVRSIDAQSYWPEANPSDWNEQANTSLTLIPVGASAPEQSGGFPGGYFYMTTKSAEAQNLVLESSPLTLREVGNYTGMWWKAELDADGSYFLTSNYLEETLRLESSDGQTPAAMQPKLDVTGMSWKAVPAGDGYYYLTSLYMEPKNRVLTGGVGDARGAGTRFDGAPYMVDIDSADDNALWKFIPVPSE